MKIINHGHSCIQIETEGKSLIIDPFLRGNPAAISTPDDIKTDAVLLTHAHMDHILDAEPIALSNDAPVVAIVELATYMGWKGVKTIPMNMGGTVDLGFAKATMIQAFHSSGIVLEDEQRIMYAGMPAGFIIRVEGLTILHTGDTSLFGDMKMFGELYSIDVAFLPIGGHFTMGPEDAAIAAEWLGAKLVVPIHFNTFPMINQDAPGFIELLAKRGVKGQALTIGETLEL
ncbi:metal-dependent hydrolase [Paenibacillus psychroresistens]|uniref:UPF0173 metal-dependent hydrolase EHS13_29615 n=1 Tax=Paenibacillus psychroresistens TaxID=1778678 RepID=A0A6B8RSM5_9BACL|nr:metal-dependent hydrolase [Paenibacillus psychroresistens]QGQ98742.1 metal-dependent hydrolase [Paenibacillus psychroresistens]